MTNEEIVIRIQDGETELYPLLWDKTKLLLFKIMRSKTFNTRLPTHITVEDLEQEMFFALCKAVNYFDREKGLLFTSYLTYPVLTVLRDTIFCDKSTVKETSFNEPINDVGEKEKWSTVIDAKSEQAFFDIEISEIQIKVRAAVAALPERQRAAVSLYFFHGSTLSEIAEQLQVNTLRAGQIINTALRTLRRKPDIIALHYERVFHVLHKESEYERYAKEWEYSYDCLKAEIELSNRIANGEALSYGKQQAFMRIAKNRFIWSKVDAAAEIRAAMRNRL